MTPQDFQQRLLHWFDQHGRKDLPWQRDINPYRVWLSEIMLQQTQVGSVIPYFNRFVDRFPTIQSLAEAEVDEVLQLWAGLGYYARARNLHKTAGIVADTGGNFPQTIEALSALPGIGRSTAGAILSIACGQSQPILDGNVKRVLARFRAVEGWPGDSKVGAILWQVAESYTPTQRCGDYTQAMMDLGATLCTRSKPACERCPLIDGCQAHRQRLTDQLPSPKPRKTLPVKRSCFLILQDQDGRILLEKRPPTGIWGGLWCLPGFEHSEQIDDWCQQLGLIINHWQELGSQRHSFSHYHLDYTTLRAKLQNRTNSVMEGNRSVWYKADEIDLLGLPAPIKRLLQQHTEELYDQNG